MIQIVQAKGEFVINESYAPKHRAEVTPKSHRFFTRSRIAVVVGLAAAATGVAIGTGAVGANADFTGATNTKNVAISTSKPTATVERTPAVTRSLDRMALANRVKQASLSSEKGAAVTQTAQTTPTPTPILNGDPRAIAKSLMPSFGMSSSDFDCIDRIWTQESGWQVTATNPSSGAYGIPQSLPADKMASAGSDWRTNPATQIKWGLGYIKDRYGSACNAANFKFSHGWY